MDCRECGSALGDGANFCARCGTRVGEGGSGARRTDIRVDTRVGEGEATGLRVGEIRSDEVFVQNNTFVLVDPSADVLRTLGKVERIPTEVAPGARPDGVSPDETEALEAPVQRILAGVREAENRGERVERVRVGDVQVGRVDLLVKQAVLLRADADRLLLEGVDPLPDEAAGPVEIDLADYVGGMDFEGYRAKLLEARGLLQEARELEPTNAEVLLHLAKVAGDLDEDVDEVRDILYQVTRLLEPPRNDVDRFHLAQATFLSALAGETPHWGQLRDARDMFERLGRSDWVRHCDDLLDAGPGEGGAPAAGIPGVAGGTAAPGHGFAPPGQWQVAMSTGGALALGLDPGGGMQGIQFVNAWTRVPFQGQWGFDPGSGALHLQGLVQGMTPFALQILIQGRQGHAFHGVGSDGVTYLLTPAG